MDYHKSSTPLWLREYGRNVQQMVEFLETVKDVEKRTQMAHEIIRIMSMLSPNGKEMADYKEKLWDHLYQMGDFKPELNGPFAKPKRKTSTMSKMERPAYYTHAPRYKQYGRNIELMIAKVVGMEEGPQKENLILFTANLMKQFLQHATPNSSSDAVVFEHLGQLSGGKIRLKAGETSLRTVQTPLNTMISNVNKPTQHPKRKKKKKKKKFKGPFQHKTMG